ncbi:CBS domain-containing protein [Variovorax soli]|uniref:CBS domain-containing protein n=1 Tax=Variovorax soli TaxID=376815 RepID=A0ABU1NI60_9BURK|nr:CBS domain-containing protein [Variovorax soli]MDR6538142.1 CBS domain-containing protein [Variovorax soli]
MLVKDICTLDVAACGRNASIFEAACTMRKHHTGDVVVVDDPTGERTPAGIVTDRDIVLEALVNEVDMGKTPVSTIMSSHLVIANADEDVLDAMDRMRLHGVRRLPVVDHGGRLVGIVTLDDILSMHADQFAVLAGIVSKEINREQRTRR